MTAKEALAKIAIEDGKKLEALVARGKKNKFAVICHPHPLYGGNMDNNVVLAARDAFFELGFGTLRFNFRGVGSSTGGFGEGDGEALDVIGVCEYLKDQSAVSIHIAAYSFGAFALLKAINRGLNIDSATLISPPVSFMDFSDLSLPTSRCLIVVGDADQYCSLADLENWLESKKDLSTGVEKGVLPNTDHFYWGSERELAQKLIDFWSDAAP